MKVAFSVAARDDLIEITLYIAEGNPRRALSFVDELEAKCLALGRAPGIGTMRPGLGDGVRMSVYSSYLIFYREQEDELRIERVMHGAREIESDDFEAGG